MMRPCSSTRTASLGILPINGHKGTRLPPPNHHLYQDYIS
jgi:hypothetical protein